MEVLVKNSGFVMALIAVTIVSVGLNIYNTSLNEINTNDYVESLNSQEVEYFNSQWTSYAGSQSGATIKAMISRLIANASTYDEDDKLPDLYYTATESSSELIVDSNEFDKNIDDFNTARNSIEAKHNYYVTIEYDEFTGLVNVINVHYSQPIYGE